MLVISFHVVYTVEIVMCWRYEALSLFGDSCMCEGTTTSFKVILLNLHLKHSLLALRHKF